jgi:SEC-C motif-containing protein
MKSEARCPCDSGRSYGECCKPFISGAALPDTAEKLMRSRYSAYVAGEIDHVERTCDPESRDSFDKEAALSWAKESEWLGLQIIATREGNPGDKTGEVEFKAHYRRDGKETVHHEVSLFKFLPVNGGGQWFYSDGRDILQPMRSEQKAGRNDPCPCGSGKKFKKCCG